MIYISQIDLHPVVNYSNGESFFALVRTDVGGYDVSFEAQSDGVHTYRAKLENNIYRIILLLTGTAAASSSNTIRVHFGIGSSIGTTEFYLEEIRTGTGNEQIPEPSSIAILALGLFGIGYTKKRRSNQ